LPPLQLNNKVSKNKQATHVEPIGDNDCRCEAASISVRINHGKKINWLTTVSGNSPGAGNLFVADLSTAITVYKIS